MSRPSKFFSWLYWKNHRKDYDEVSKLPWPTDYSNFDRSVLQNTPSLLCPICGGAEELCYLTPYAEHEDANGNELYCICSSLTFQKHIAEMKERVGGRVQYKSLDNFRIQGSNDIEKDKMRNNLETAKMWADKPTFWMLMAGDNGTGKTHIMWSLYHIVEPIAVYINTGRAEQLLHRNRRSDTVPQFIDDLSNAPVLFLDDWGMETGGNFFNGALNTIIDNRWVDAPEKITIVATNNRPSTMKESNKRVYSRIMDVNSSVLLDFFGFADIRRKRSKSNA